MQLCIDSERELHGHAHVPHNSKLNVRFTWSSFSLPFITINYLFWRCCRILFQRLCNYNLFNKCIVCTIVVTGECSCRDAEIKYKQRKQKQFVSAFFSLEPHSTRHEVGGELECTHFLFSSLSAQRASLFSCSKKKRSLLSCCATTIRFRFVNGPVAYGLPKKVRSGDLSFPNSLPHFFCVAFLICQSRNNEFIISFGNIEPNILSRCICTMEISL